MPNAAFVASALSSHSNIQSAFDNPDSIVLGAGWQGASYSTTSSSPLQYDSTITWNLNTTSLVGDDLVLGLMDNQASGAGFSSLTFEVLVGNSTVVDQNFTSLSAAQAYFSDDALDLGTITSGVANSTVEVEFDLTASTNGSGFGEDFVLGAAAPCYCPGTLIRTEYREQRVEDLNIGDKVLTAAGVARPIKWIGRRSYRGRFAMGRKDILPVCIKAGALDHDTPKRDLWISPNHAMYLDGVLIEAKDLVNGVSIVQAERVEQIEYFHIELDSHDVIMAEGAPSESFIDDDSREMFHNAHQYRVLYPDALMVAGARYCAPRLDEGYELETIRQRIALRAGLVPSDLTTRAGRLRGFVDRVTPHVIEGWAQNAEYPEAPVCLDIFAGNRLIGQVLANQYREDLAHAGPGSGRHAFAFSLTQTIDVALDAVEVRRSLDGAPLSRSVQAEDVELATAA